MQKLFFIGFIFNKSFKLCLGLNAAIKEFLTPTESKREVPDGLWFKSPAGKIVHTRELKNNAYVVPDEDYHVRIGSEEYFEVLFDENKFTELDANMESADPLKFKDTKALSQTYKGNAGKVTAEGRCADCLW